MSSTKVTTDHEEIQQWVEERGGRPSRVKGTNEENGSGVLVIDYPGYSGEETLEAITWDEFFEGFEENQLAFLYEDEEKSRFSKLVSRETAEEKKAARSGSRR